MEHFLTFFLLMLENFGIFPPETKILAKKWFLSFFYEDGTILKTK